MHNLIPQKPKPEDTEGGVSLEQMARYRRTAELKTWAATGWISTVVDRYFSTPEGLRWYWKSPAITLGCGIPSLLLLLGQFYVPWLNAHFGNFFSGYITTLRVLMLIAAFILLALAAPIQRPLGWKPADDEKNQELHEEFQRKFRR